MILYHFVCPWRFEFIMNNGCIRARPHDDCPFVGDRPVVWLSKSPQVQMHGDELNLGVWHRICLRLKVPTKDPQLFHMQSWQRSNMLRQIPQCDERRNWWVYFNDIPIAAIQDITLHNFSFKAAEGATQEDIAGIEAEYQRQLAAVGLAEAQQ
jgi:hypothetical protein